MLERDWRSYRNRGVVFLGVDYNDLGSDARRFVSAHGLTFPMLEDGSGNVTQGSYGVSQVPETYVLNRQGRVVAHLPGRSRIPVSRASSSGDREGRGVKLRLVAVAAAALVFAAPAAACAHPRTSLGFLEGQVMCPTCHTTLDMSDSAAAQQIRMFIAKKIAACWTAQQIETALVAELRPGDPRRAVAQGVRPARVVAADRGRARRRGRPRVRRLALEPGQGAEEPDEPADSGLDEETEQKIDDLLAGFD